MTLPKAIRLQLSLATLAMIARDPCRDCQLDGAAWRGVMRQVRRYSDELRWVQHECAVADDTWRPQ